MSSKFLETKTPVEESYLNSALNSFMAKLLI